MIPSGPNPCPPPAAAVRFWPGSAFSRPFPVHLLLARESGAVVGLQLLVHHHCPWTTRRWHPSTSQPTLNRSLATMGQDRGINEEGLTGLSRNALASRPSFGR